VSATKRSDPQPCKSARLEDTLTEPQKRKLREHADLIVRPNPAALAFGTATVTQTVIDTITAPSKHS